jgi:hypothetical protein
VTVVTGYPSPLLYRRLRHLPGVRSVAVTALFARSAGVAPGADIPVPLLLAAIPATLALAILIAAGPGWAAARIRPARVLRAE